MSTEDIAQEVELRQWEQNNRSRPYVVRYAPGEAGYGPMFCIVEECGADMPPERRAWGFALCVACLARQEQRARHIIR